MLKHTGPLSRIIYVAGPMRGYPEHNIPLFRSTAAHLRALGPRVVSPVEVGEMWAGSETDQSQHPPEAWVTEDLRVLLNCNAIALLPGWDASVGARCDVAVAMTLGFTFVDATTGEPMPRPARVVVTGGYDQPPGRVDAPEGDSVSEAARLAVAEVRRAVRIHPTWPTDPMHAIAVVNEEVGEVTKAILEHTYERHKGVTADDVRTEAIECAAMASVRFVASLDRYEYVPCPQHIQGLPARANVSDVGVTTGGVQ